jgi:hypothetical protein
MKRRTFLKYSVTIATATVFPQLIYANGFTKSIKTALYCSNLHPVRLIAGLIFDKASEIYLKPLAEMAFKQFWNGYKFTRSDLSYYSSLSSIPLISAYEEYKASTVIDGIVDYEKYKEETREKLKILLTRNIDKQRFGNIYQYFRDEKVKVKLYNRPYYFEVGNYLEPNHFFNIKHLYFSSHKQRHIEELLHITNNKAFGELIV